MSISPERVEELFLDCLSKEGSIVEGITANFGMDVTGHEDEIGGMLSHLPNEFMAQGGGGWTFLNACMDKKGDQWTGSHRTMEQLFVLGIAADKAQWLLPKDMWPALPGGLPYVVIK